MEPATRNQQDVPRADVFFQATVTLVVLVFVGLALDDITTDDATGFLPEYTLLAAAGTWCLFVAYTLLRKGWHVIGAASVVAGAAAASVGFDGLGHKRDGGWSAFWPEYSVMLATWLWFMVLTVILFARRRRSMPTGVPARLD